MQSARDHAYDISECFTPDFKGEAIFDEEKAVQLVSARDAEWQARVDTAYSERCALAIAFAALCQDNGIHSGWYKDPDHIDWDDKWRTVVVIEGPIQLSWHMDPAHSEMAQAILPNIQPCWDGTQHGSDPDWPIKHIVGFLGNKARVERLRTGLSKAQDRIDVLEAALINLTVAVEKHDFLSCSLVAQTQDARAALGRE